MTALAVLALAACNSVLGVEDPPDEVDNATTGGSHVDSPTTSSTSSGTGTANATGTGGTRVGSGGTGGSGAGGSGAGGSGTTPGQGGSSNGTAPDGGGRTVAFAWAEWPMPNPTSSGLPYPQTYDTTTAMGVVLDRVTGLSWQQALEDTVLNAADARTYCANLALAGGGWRLPTRIELLSIVDYTSPNPAIDLRSFPGTPTTRFWTTSPVADEVSSAWVVDFAFGNGFAYSALTSTAYRVRCVR